MRHVPLAAVLVFSVPVLSASVLSADAPSPVAAEVEKGVKAYNAQDIAYYERVLSPDAVYIAEDGAIFAGKERVLRVFSRIFGKTPVRQLPGALVGPQTTPSPATALPSPSPSPSPVPGPVAEALAQVVEQRYGSQLEAADLEEIKKGIEDNLQAADRLKKALKLTNAD